MLTVSTTTTPRRFLEPFAPLISERSADIVRVPLWRPPGGRRTEDLGRLPTDEETYNELFEALVAALPRLRPDGEKHPTARLIVATTAQVNAEKRRLVYDLTRPLSLSIAGRLRLDDDLTVTLDGNVWEATWEALRSGLFDPARSKLSTYVFKIALRGGWALREGYQRHVERIRAAADALIDEEEDFAAGADAELGEVRRFVHVALARLNADDRAILTARYLQDLPLSEIGAGLGISLMTATQRLHRARRRLADLIRTNLPLRRFVEDSGFDLGLE